MHSRQKLIVGEEGQQRIHQSSVAIVGMGALGTMAAELLVRAGIGRLVIIDRDVVEESNLQRQTLYSQKDIGRSKAVAAKERLSSIDPSVMIDGRATHLNAGNLTLLNPVDILLDCTDNQQTRFILNDYCKKNKKPWIYGAAIKTSGYVMPVLPDGPCLRCFMREGQLETCEQAGVLNTITTSIAALQVQIGLDILLEKKVPLLLYYYNINTKSFKELKINKNRECRTCAHRFEYLVPKEETKLVKFCGSGRYQVSGSPKDFLLLPGTRDGSTLQMQNILLFEDGRALINAGSEEEALSLYSKWIGN